MDHGELLEHVDGREFYEAQRVTIRNPGKSKELLSVTNSIFLKILYFVGNVGS